MINDKNVVFPNELLEGMEIETSIFPNNSNQIGVAVLSQKIKLAHNLRIYQLLFNETEQAYEPVQELAAFSFTTRNELLHFLRNLPHLNGIEMLMLLNPIDGNTEFVS